MFIWGRNKFVLFMTEKNQNNKNKGFLFKNDKKTTEKQPDFRGKVAFSENTIRLSAWKNIVNNEERIDILGVPEKDFIQLMEKKKNENPMTLVSESVNKTEEYYDPDIDEIFKDFF